MDIWNWFSYCNPFKSHQTLCSLWIHYITFYKCLFHLLYYFKIQDIQKPLVRVTILRACVLKIYWQPSASKLLIILLSNHIVMIHSLQVAESIYTVIPQKKNCINKLLNGSYMSQTLWPYTMITTHMLVKFLLSTYEWRITKNHLWRMANVNCCSHEMYSETRYFIYIPISIMEAC